MQKRNLVFISHDASLSGAPILLLHLIWLLQASGKYNITIIVKNSGELDDQFKAAGDTIFVKNAGYDHRGNFFKQQLKSILKRWRMMQIRRRCIKADLVFNNTITNGRLLKKLRFDSSKLVTYVHELADAAKGFEVFNDTQLTLQYTGIFIYPSEAVSRFLQDSYAVPSNRLRHLPYNFPTRAAISAEDKIAARSNFLTSHQLPESNLLVVSMGTISQRKGIDYFLQTAAATLLVAPNISFVWIGGYNDPNEEQFVKAYLASNPLPNVIFTGKMPPAQDSLLPFDVFYLPSREDPYPLVVLEAAYVGIPSICFRGGGGIVDFVNSDAGWIIEAFDTGKVRDLLLQVCRDKDSIHTKGAIAKEKVMARHFNADAQLAAFDEIVEWAKG